MIRFLGPNGAGKTTALKMLSSILYPTSGSDSFYLIKCNFGISDSDYRDIVAELTELLDVWALMNV